VILTWQICKVADGVRVIGGAADAAGLWDAAGAAGLLSIGCR
jgi:hypothetical protein